MDGELLYLQQWLTNQTEFEKITDLLAEDITLQMGRPISSAKGEINGTLYRARYLIKAARDALKPLVQEEESSDSMKLEIVKQPLGVIA